MESWYIARYTFSVVLNVQDANERCYVVERIVNRNFRPFSSSPAKVLLSRSERYTFCGVTRLCKNCHCLIFFGGGWGVGGRRVRLVHSTIAPFSTRSTLNTLMNAFM